MNPKAPSRFSKSSSSGFSLVEILVTTGIIAVLAAILLPAMKKTIDASHTAGCASNLSQIGKAMFAFAADNDGRLPLADDGSKSWPVSPYMYQLNPYLGNLPSVTFEQQKKICFDGVFRCPGKKDWTLSGPTDLQRLSYGMNTFDSQYDPKIKLMDSKKLVSIESPSKTLLVADQQTGWWALRNAHYMYRDFRALRHAKSDNVLFCDGHVAAMPKDSFFYELVLKE